jgi:hypothetical protein
MPPVNFFDSSPRAAKTVHLRPEFGSRWLSCAVAEVKNLDLTLMFVYSVVNQEWAVQQFPNSRPFVDDAAHARKAGQQINVVQQRTAEAGSYVGVVFGYVADDFG